MAIARAIAGVGVLGREEQQRRLVVVNGEQRDRVVVALVVEHAPSVVQRAHVAPVRRRQREEPARVVRRQHDDRHRVPAAGAGIAIRRMRRGGARLAARAPCALEVAHGAHGPFARVAEEHQRRVDGDEVARPLVKTFSAVLPVFFPRARRRRRAVRGGVLRLRDAEVEVGCDDEGGRVVGEGWPRAAAAGHVDGAADRPPPSAGMRIALSVVVVVVVRPGPLVKYVA